MRSLFRGHFNYTEQEFKKLWDDALVSFDTNVLLDLYRYQKSSADAFLQVLKMLAEANRVWLPYQVAAEFFRQRQDEIANQFTGYDKLLRYLDGVTTQFRIAFPRHSHLPLDKYKQQLSAAIDAIKDDVTKSKSSHSDVTNTNTDGTLQALTAAFEGRVGGKPDKEEIKRLIDLCQRRFEAGMPPTAWIVRTPKSRATRNLAMP